MSEFSSWLWPAWLTVGYGAVFAIIIITANMVFEHEAEAWTNGQVMVMLPCRW